MLSSKRMKMTLTDQDRQKYGRRIPETIIDDLEIIYFLHEKSKCYRARRT